ncbi:DedA family protein [Lentibacillus sp. N15]|uniref:DedA family protein n=1 Tax=Lentibacillus songyuanensis TaxID=3136161 RepID=UPI0031B9CEA8
MQAWVTEIMEQFGYIGVFFMMVLENVFPPIPSEVILPFAGFMTTTTQLTIMGVVITSTTGSVLGAIILYGIGKLIDVKRLDRMVSRWGHIIRIKREDIQKADDWFNRYGYWTVLVCRVIPLVRSLISIPAGMSSMKFGLFLLFTMIGTLTWNVILILIGTVLGEAWTSILLFMNLYSTITYILIGTGIVVFLILFIWKKRKKKK